MQNYRNLNDIFCIDTSENVKCELDMAVEGVMDDDAYAANYHFANLVFEELASIPNSVHRECSFFRFTSLPVLKKGTPEEKKPVIDDIRRGALTFANPRLFNDPMDPILREWILRKRKKARSVIDRKIFRHLRQSLDNIRICCLSVNRFSRRAASMHLNPLMWAHYADMHKGICIEYEITDDMLSAHNDEDHILRLCDVRYRNRKVMSDYITLDNALLAKGTSWEYEHESRLIYFSREERTIGRTLDDYVSVSGFRIKSIYLGYRINKNNRRDVIEAVRNRDIEIYQVYFDENDITQLKAARVDLQA